MSSDIRSILQRLSMVEAATSPATVSKGLTAQQQSVPQLPALFKPKKISVLGAATDPQHPAAGYAVGANEASDTSLQKNMASVEEEMLSRVKHGLNSYLDQLERKVKVDRALKDKARDAVQKGTVEQQHMPEPQHEIDQPETVHGMQGQMDRQSTAPVKTVAMEDGALFEIHGDETQGFEVRFGRRSLPTRFPKLDHAQTAIQLFQARRRAQDLSQDYIEER